MLTLSPAVEIHVFSRPVDMRKQHDGLAAIVAHELERDPLSGHLYVFFNRNRDRVKVLWFDRGGYALLYKRLERGRFTFPSTVGRAARVRIDAGELALILEGIDLRGATWRDRWTPHVADESRLS